MLQTEGQHGQALQWRKLGTLEGLSEDGLTGCRRQGRDLQGNVMNQFQNTQPLSQGKVEKNWLYFQREN